MFCYKTNSTNKENRVKKIPGNSRTNFPGFRDNKIAGIPGISRPGNSREKHYIRVQQMNTWIIRIQYQEM